MNSCRRSPSRRPVVVPYRSGNWPTSASRRHPPSIEHENFRRRTFVVSANVRGRDVASSCRRPKSGSPRRCRCPPGIRSPGRRLRKPALRQPEARPHHAGGAGTDRDAALHEFQIAPAGRSVFFAVPVAASGGVAALALRHAVLDRRRRRLRGGSSESPCSTGSSGSPAPEHARRGGLSAREAAVVTADVRIRPVLMTALVASLRVSADGHGDVLRGGNPAAFGDRRDRGYRDLDAAHRLRRRHPRSIRGSPRRPPAPLNHDAPRIPSPDPRHVPRQGRGPRRRGRSCG